MDEKKPMSTEDGCHHIYLIKADNGLYKIGRAKNLGRRLDTLGNMSPCKLELAFALKVRDVGSIEARLHHLFSEKRSHGEWFRLTDNDVESIKTLLRLWEDEFISEKGKIRFERRKRIAKTKRMKPDRSKQIDFIASIYENFVSTKEAADHLGISRSAVQQACHRDQFPNAFQDPRGQWQIPLDDLKDYRRPHMQAFSNEEIMRLPELVSKIGLGQAAKMLEVHPQTVRKALAVAKELEEFEAD